MINANMEIKVKNTSDFKLPRYRTIGSSGLDLQANLDKGVNNGDYSFYKELTIKPFETVLVNTGISIELPIGYEAQVRPRSSLSLKGLVSQLGTIDSDYRGEIGVILHNNTNRVQTINHGDRIAQLVIVQIQRIEFKLVEQLSSTERNTAGFGSTGL